MGKNRDGAFQQDWPKSGPCSRHQHQARQSLGATAGAACQLDKRSSMAGCVIGKARFLTGALAERVRWTDQCCAAGLGAD